MLTNMTHFGEWIKWESAMQVDSRWHQLLSSVTDSQLRFKMCATEDVLPTAGRLRCIGVGDGRCPLGCNATGSLRHILCGCRLEEKPQSRVTWRHDSVLYAFFKFLLTVVNQRKERQQLDKRRRSRSNSVPNIVFKTEAGVKCATDSSPWKRWLESETPRGVLGSALDWKLQFDVHAPEMGQTKNETFPCEILPGITTSARRSTLNHQFQMKAHPG